MFSSDIGHYMIGDINMLYKLELFTLVKFAFCKKKKKKVENLIKLILLENQNVLQFKNICTYH